MPAPWIETADADGFRARFDAVDVSRQEHVEMATFMARIKENPVDDPGSAGMRIALVILIGGVLLVARIVGFVAELRGIVLEDGEFAGWVAGLSALLFVAAVLGLRRARGISVGQSLRTMVRFVFPTHEVQSYVDKFRIELTPEAFLVVGAHQEASSLRIPLEVVRGFDTSPAGVVVHGNDGRAYPLPCTLLDAATHVLLARRLDQALAEMRASLRIAAADRGGYRGEDLPEDAAAAPTAARMRR